MSRFRLHSLVKMAKPVFRSVTLVVFLVLFVGINTQGDDKEQKNGGDRKTQLGLDLAVC